MATALRDYGTTNKLNVGYDELTKKVTLGNKTLAPEQLKALGGQLVNNSWQFDDVSKLNTLTGVKPPEPTPSEPTPPVQTPTTPTTPDYSSQISGMFNAERDMLLNQLKQKIAESKAQQEGIIKNAPKQFDPLRAQSELSKGQQLRSVLERNANLGDRGGIGRSVALQTQVAGENRLNAINLQQQDVIDTANQRIADLESQGRFEEADIIQRQKLAELEALMKESQRQDELRRGEMATAETQSRSDFNNTIMANYNDLMGLANQLRSQDAPQWQIDAVLAARQQKIAEQGLDQMGRPLPVDTTPQLTSSSAALELWQQLGVANEAISRALGVPVGQRYTDTSRSSGGSGSGGGTPNPDDDPKVILSYLESTLRGTNGSSAADLLIQLNDLGFMENLTQAEINNLNKKFGVTNLMLEQAYNRRDAFTSQAPYRPEGIPLPSEIQRRLQGQGLINSGIIR